MLSIIYDLEFVLRHARHHAGCRGKRSYLKLLILKLLRLLIIRLIMEQINYSRDINS